MIKKLWIAKLKQSLDIQLYFWHVISLKGNKFVYHLNINVNKRHIYSKILDERCKKVLILRKFWKWNKKSVNTSYLMTFNLCIHCFVSSKYSWEPLHTPANNNDRGTKRGRKEDCRYEDDVSVQQKQTSLFHSLTFSCISNT